jgi:hypothetical protein
MTNTPDQPDLAAIAQEAQVEILAAETIQGSQATPDDAALALSATELGYYEAELESLRDAATTLDESDQQPG